MNITPRFLCDEMLGHLCRYLRAAGYDALFDTNGLPDRVLLQQCKEQQRYFLTKDQLIIEHKAALGVAYILPNVDLDQLAAIVGAHFELDWLSHSFTRCMEDNTPLLAADAAALLRIPQDVQKSNEPFSYCPNCARVYWRGSHYKRIKSRLILWESALLESTRTRSK
jgi:uncharacterized protein